MTLIKTAKDQIIANNSELENELEAIIEKIFIVRSTFNNLQRFKNVSLA